MQRFYAIPVGLAVVCLLSGGELKGQDLLASGVKSPIIQSSLSFVLIPAGTFTMGDLSGQDGHSKPAHQVTISKPFLMQTTHVTVGQFKEFVKATGYRTDAEKSGGCYVWVGYWTEKANASWKYPNSYL